MKYARIVDGRVDAVSLQPASGYIKVPDTVFAGDLYTNGVFTPQNTAPTPTAVNVERDRRILQGNTFALSTGKEISLRGDDTTKENLQALAFAATLRIQQGAANSITLFRDNTDYVHELTQAEVLELWSKSAEFVSTMFQAAWFLKDGPAIPQDYTDDAHWKV